VTTQFLGGPFTVFAMGALVVVFAVGVAWRIPQVRQIRIQR
jgi:hypothetical protein